MEKYRYQSGKIFINPGKTEWIYTVTQHLTASSMKTERFLQLSSLIFFSELLWNEKRPGSDEQTRETVDC